MKKTALRYSALGLIVAAIGLIVFQLFFVGEASDSKEDVQEASYQTRYEALLVEHEALLAKQKEEKTKDSSKVSASEPSESAEDESASDESEPEESVASTPEEEPTSIVVIVHEGQPSSVVLDHLLSAGLIDDVESATAYLTENDLLSRIQVGSFTFTTDQTQTEILNQLTTVQE